MIYNHLTRLMNAYERQQQQIEQLLRETKIIKAYATRVETQLEELMGGVGTAQKTRLKKQEKEDELRMRVRERFANPKAKLFNTKKATI